MKKICLALVAAVTLTFSQAHAASFESGLAAYEAGRYDTAFEVFDELARFGHADAQYRLAIMYFWGRGVEKSDVIGLMWLNLAADQRYPDAMASLGVRYDIGYGVEKNTAKALRLIRLAAELGLARAQFAMGGKYAEGEGVQQNYAEAFRWYALSAKQRFTGGHSGLARMYRDGTGVEQSYIHAYMWYSLAMANGYNATLVKEDSGLRDEVKEKMTQADIATANRMVTECIASDYENCGY